MFELHLGDKLSVPSTLFDDPLFLTGRPGQGKSVTFLAIAHALVRNRQSGLIVDPYGDLAAKLKEQTVVKGMANRVVFGGFEMDLATLRKHLKANKLVVVAARFLVDGERKGREEGIKLLKRYFRCAAPGNWLLIDESFAFVDDTIIEKFLQVKKMGLKVVFSDIGFYRLSEDERSRFCKLFGFYIIYKVMNFDAECLAKYNPALNPKNIAAIQQYHFQFLQGGKLSYHKGVWPLEL